MSKYVLVSNSPNSVATVHAAACTYLGSSPLESTASSTRSKFVDGLEALAAAQEAMPRNFGLCGHCLRRFSQLRFVRGVGSSS
jgi:hypothetical protein